MEIRCENVNWIQMNRDWVQFWVFMNTVYIPLVSIKDGESFDQLIDIQLLKDSANRSWLYEVLEMEI